MLVSAGMAARTTLAQTVPGLLPGIVVTGTGTATAPATAAKIQLIIGGDMYAAAPPAALTDAELGPITAAIVAAGVATDEIEVFNPATTSMFTGPGSPGAVMLRFEIPDPTDSAMTDLVQALYQSAQDARLSIYHVGVRYLAEDCVSLQQSASDAAVADARERAGRLADSLGVELGQLTQAMDSGAYISLPDSCADTPVPVFGPYGPGVDAPFDASAPVQASVTTQVTLTFEMLRGDGATPTAG
jgi:uncharacterized protein YggE